MIPLGVFGSARVPASGEPVGYTYIGAQGGAVDTTTSRTYTAQAIGTASPNRTVIIAAHSRGTAGRPATGVTVAGIAATKHVEFVDGVTSTQIWTAAVPTGATADIVLTYSATSEAQAIGVWAAYGTLTFSTSGTSGDAGNSITLTAPANCLSIAAHSAVTTGIGSAYTTLTENYRNSDYVSHAGASGQPSAGSHTVAVTGSAGSNSSAVVVDFTLT